MKNYADLRGCYPPQPLASAGNTLLDLHNSSYHTQPHPIIVNCNSHSERNAPLATGVLIEGVHGKKP